jgi:hypothetical protein
MTKTTVSITTIHTTTDSFKARLPYVDRTSRMRVAMLFDMVGAAAITTGGLTPSFPKTGSSDGSRTGPRMSRETNTSIAPFSNALHAKWEGAGLAADVPDANGRVIGGPVIWRQNFNAATLQAGIADGTKACLAAPGEGRT